MFITDVAIQSLNSMKIGEKYLVVQRASVVAKLGMPNLPYDQFSEIPRPIMPAGENALWMRVSYSCSTWSPPKISSRTKGTGIFTKMSKESFRYGAVEDLRIPRPIKEDKTKFASGDTTFQASLDAQRADEAAGVDRVYVKFVDAQDALKALGGWSFAGRSIIATVLNEDN